MEASQSAYSNLIINKSNIPNKADSKASGNDSGIMAPALDFNMDDDLELTINAQNIDDSVVEKKISSSYLRSVKSESAIFNTFSKANGNRGSPTSLGHRSSQGSFSSAEIEMG